MFTPSFLFFKKREKTMKIIYDKKQIENFLDKVVSEIEDDIRQNNKQNILLVGILKACMFFIPDVSKRMETSHEITFIGASSQDNNSPSDLFFNFIPKINSYQNIYLLDTVIDSGKTIFETKKLLLAQQPTSIKTVCLINKIPNRKYFIIPDIYGTLLTMPDYLVGYGLDNNQKERNLTFIKGI